MKTKSSQKRAGKNKASSTLLRWGIPLLLIVGVAMIFVLSRSPLQTDSKPPQSGVGIGDIAPDFSVLTLEEGELFVLSENRGKPTIILFMAYWCAPAFQRRALWRN